MSFCHKFWFSNPYIFVTRCSRSSIFQTMASVWSKSCSLKYHRFTPSNCKARGIRKFELVAKTQFLYSERGGKEILTTFLFFLQFYAYVCFTLDAKQFTFSKVAKDQLPTGYIKGVCRGEEVILSYKKVAFSGYFWLYMTALSVLYVRDTQTKFKVRILHFAQFKPP